MNIDCWHRLLPSNGVFVKHRSFRQTCLWPLTKSCCSSVSESNLVFLNRISAVSSSSRTAYTARWSRSANKLIVKPSDVEYREISWAHTTRRAQPHQTGLHIVSAPRNMKNFKPRSMICWRRGTSGLVPVPTVHQCFSSLRRMGAGGCV